MLKPTFQPGECSETPRVDRQDHVESRWLTQRQTAYKDPLLRRAKLLIFVAWLKSSNRVVLPSSSLLCHRVVKEQERLGYERDERCRHLEELNAHFRCQVTIAGLEVTRQGLKSLATRRPSSSHSLVPGLSSAEPSSADSDQIEFSSSVRDILPRIRDYHL
jgi:hypothetical protein